MSRSATGQFKESDDVSRSLKQRPSAEGQDGSEAGKEIGATGKVFVFFSNRLGCAGFAAAHQGRRRDRGPGGV